MAHCRWRGTAPVDSVWGAQEKRLVKCLHPQPQLFVRAHSETRYEDRRKERQITNLLYCLNSSLFQWAIQNEIAVFHTLMQITINCNYRINLKVNCAHQTCPSNPYFHKTNQVKLNIIPEPHWHVKISVFSTTRTVSDQTELWRHMTIQELMAFWCWGKLKFCEQANTSYDIHYHELP